MKRYIGVTVVLAVFLSLMFAGYRAEALEPSDILVYDPLDGTTLGTRVGAPLPAFVPGVFGQGVQPLRNSTGPGNRPTSAAVLYNIIPPSSGSLSFWLKVVAPIEFYRGPNIGWIGREDGGCDDFFMQLQESVPTRGLDVAIFSGAGGTVFRDNFTEPLDDWLVGEIHHVAMSWGAGQKPVFYLDGVATELTGAALPFVPGCSANIPFIFAAARILNDSYSPGAFVFDDFAMMVRRLTDTEIDEIFVKGQDGLPLPLTTIVTIDIKPGSDKNPVNPRSKGVLPVAILSDEDFDARDVDGTTVTLAGVAPAHGAGHLEDVDDDGDIDWVGHFSMRELTIPGDGVLVLTGQTHDEGAIEGSDTVTRVGRTKVSVFPNPANPATTIAYTINEDSQITVTVFNTLGQQVRQLVNEHKGGTRRVGTART